MKGRVSLMKKFIISLLVNTLVLIVVAGYMDTFYIKDVTTALLASVLLAALNVFLKPLFILFTLPITIFTFGIFLIFINTFMLLIASYLMGDIFHFDNFWTAFIASIFISLLSKLIDIFFKKED
jgi:putative membrane protein